MNNFPDKQIALEVHDLTVAYGKKSVLWSVDFEIPSGALACIVGPNGAGKSTLLKTCLNLLKPESGFVRIFNKDMGSVRKMISYVPQKESVDWNFPITVREVVMMGRFHTMGFFKRATKADNMAVDEALEKVGMADRGQSFISQLSGGQQQRVFLARALAQQAQIYFLDEPFAGIDKATEEAIVVILQELQRDGVTCVVVHHDLSTISKYFDFCVMLNTRLIVADYVRSIDLEDKLSETFGGRLNLLSAIITEIENKP